MNPCDLKKELEKRCLLNPIITEAIDMAKRGVTENYVFCWAAVKLVDEAEALKNEISKQRVEVKLHRALIDDQKYLLDEYKVMIDEFKNRLMMAEAAMTVNNIPVTWKKL